MKPTEREFLEFAARTLKVESPTLDLAYGDVPEWDSVMQILLVMKFQAEYGVDVPLSKVPELKTLRDFYGMLDE